jgi:hypothetical protein
VDWFGLACTTSGFLVFVFAGFVLLTFFFVAIHHSPLSVVLIKNGYWVNGTS